MKLWNHYHTPQTIDEAATLLTQYAGQARIVAGGTDLLVDMRADGSDPHEALVDVTTISELSRIDLDGDRVVIGAGVTHTKIVKSSELVSRATCLVESCGVVGGPQVRNVGTLGGNVAHALPAGDGTTSLVALDAEVEVLRDGSREWRPILDMYLGPGKSLLDSTKDILLRFRFALCGAGEATAFSRIMRPQGVALPILGCAVRVKLDATGDDYAAAKICIAPAGPIPRRVTEVEAFLAGKPANEDTLSQAVELAQSSITPRTSKYRATADYRREMIAVLLQRTLSRAVERARTGEAVPQDVGI